MRRAYIALILAPLLVSGIFGIGALIAFPLMLLMTCVVAFPLLLWLKRIERLNWWIAVTGGAVSALLYILLNTLTPLSYGVTPDVDRLVDSNNIAYLGLGMLTGFVFGGSASSEMRRVATASGPSALKRVRSRQRNGFTSVATVDMEIGIQR
jgi:hypothetical protein